MTADALNNRGAARAAAGDRAGAFADYDAALQMNPHLAAAFNNRAVARLDAGDFDAALADLREAVRLDPQYAEAYENCAAAEVGLLEHARAVACYDRAIHLYSRHPRYRARLCRAHVLRSMARYHLGRGPAAAADLRAAYRLDPTTTAATVADLVRRNAQTDGALASCAAYLARDPDDVFTLVRRGFLHLLAGDAVAFAADRVAVGLILSRDDAAAVDAFAAALSRSAS